MLKRRTIHMSEADHKLVSDAVGLAERDTDGEIVTIVTDMSDHYADTPHIWAAVAGVLGIVLTLIFPGIADGMIHFVDGNWSADPGPTDYVLAALANGVLDYFLAHLLLEYKPLRVALSWKATKQKRVHDKAVASFKIGIESKTVGRTGVLIYLSLREHRAEIVADSAINEKVGEEEWGEALSAMLEHVRAGRPGEGMAEAVRHSGALLAKHFPKSEGNPNELPDRLIEL